MTMLNLTLFGTPQVFLDQRNLTATLAGRPLALLAYLAVTNQPHDRNLLADLLWAEIGEAEARRNLRNILYLLRQAVGDYLRAGRQTVALETAWPIWVDVTSFTEYLAGRQQHQQVELVQKAFDLYQGDFLAGLHINDAPAFESWVTARRHHLQEQAFHGWHWLANHHLETHAYGAGLAVTQRMLLLQPWREEAHRQQMLLLAANGQRSAALAQYEQCRHLLAAELAVEPMPATVVLYEQLKRGEPLALLAETAPKERVRNGHSPVSLPVRPAVALLPRLIDVGAMPITPHFQGRQTELALLHRWLVTEKRRCVTIVGMGGQGKSALAAHFVTTLRAEEHSSFDCIIWRSLLNAPPVGELLQDWLHTLCDPHPAHAPDTRNQQIAHLLQQLQRRRCLLILDNWESILPILEVSEPGTAEQQGYGQLLRTLLQTDHQSCLLLTSREQPREVTSSDESTGIIRSLALAGLDLDTGIALLTDYGLDAAAPMLVPLVQHFSGNPLALKLVIDTIDHLFGGDVTAFLAQESHFFGDIGVLLDHQFAQLTSVQRTLLSWLAIERQPVTAQMLWANLVQPTAQRYFWEALRALQRRSLVETHGNRFGLQNVILEYATERLVEQVVQGVIELAIPNECPWAEHMALNQYALLKAHTKEYIRQMQERLLVAPVAKQLVARWGSAGMAARMQALLNVLRTAAQASAADGYAATNLLTLLLYCKVDLRGYDFSSLPLRQAYLSDAVLQEVNFTKSTFREVLFTDPLEVVGAMTASPDGRWLITGSYDGLIRLWHPWDGHLHTVLDGNQREIGRLVVSPNSTWLASACSDNQVLIWHLPSLTHHLTIPVVDNFPHPLAFSPDSQWLGVDGGAGTIRLVQVESGAIVALLVGMASQPRVLAFSPSGDYVVAGDSTGMLYLWLLGNGALPTYLPPAASWPAHQSRILALLFTPDGKCLVSGGADQRIVCWALPPVAGVRSVLNSAAQWSVVAHRDMVAALAVGAGGHLLASGSPDRTVRLWDMSTGALVTTLEPEEQRVRALAFTADGTILASGGSNQRLYLWDVAWTQAENPTQPATTSITGVTTQLRQTIYGYANQVRSFAFLPNCPLLVSGGTDKALHFWDSTTGQARSIWTGHAGWIQTIAVSPDGATLASADYAQQIYLWDLHEPTGAYQVLLNQSHSGHFFIELAFSPDGQYLAACSGTTITLWARLCRTLDTANYSKQPRFVVTSRLPAAHDPITALAFHPHDNLLAGTSVTGDLYLWRLSDNQLLQHIRSTTPGGRLVAFCADGQTLVTAGMDETIDCWQVKFEDGLPVACHMQRPFCRQSGRTVALAVDPLGTTLATGTYDGWIYLWDWQSGAQRYCWQAPQGWITKVAYSPDGQILAGAATDGTITLWSVAHGSCLHILRAAGPYAAMNITGCRGLTLAQRTALKALGAVEMT